MQDPREIQKLIQKGLEELQIMKVRNSMTQCRDAEDTIYSTYARAGTSKGYDCHMASLTSRNSPLIFPLIQRQTVISQFYKLDRLVVEGGKTV